MGLQIIPTWDASITSQSPTFQAQFEGAVNAAINYFEQQFTDNVTVNIYFGWVSAPGSSLAGNISAGQWVTYSQLSNALALDVRSNDDLTAVTTLPAPTADPTNGGYFWLSDPEAKALGSVIPPTNDVYDGIVAVNAAYDWTFDPNNRAVPGLYDAVGALEHEISEVMGRTGDLGTQAYIDGPSGYSYSRQYGPMDLFRYAYAGHAGRPDVNSGLGYFSIDGNTLLTLFNNPALVPGDAGDWIYSVKGDSFGESWPGVAGLVTETDLRAMDVIGWDRSTGRPATHVSPTIAARSVQVAGSGTVSGESMIALIDNPSGDTISAYTFIDYGTGFGHFVVNGVAQPAGQRIEVAPADLGSVQYQGGTGGGSETVAVGFYDATTHSYSDMATLNATTAAPAARTTLFNFSHATTTARTADSFRQYGVPFSLSPQGGYAFLDVDLSASVSTGVATYRDITGDGRIDLIVETPTHTFLFSPGTGSDGTGGLGPASVGLQHGGPPGIIPHQVQFVDINGDGRYDSIFQGLDNRFWVAYGTADSFSLPQLVATEGGPFNPAETQYADVNGDGKSDLIFQGVDNRFWVSFGADQGFTDPSLAAVEGGPFNPDEVQYADVNGDGKADLVYQGVDNRFWISEGGTGGFGPAVLGLTHGGPFMAGQIKYADVNGDGRDDAVFQGVDNRIWLSLSNGTTFGDPVLAAVLPRDTFDVGKVQLADMNGDGKVDLMYQTGQNQIWEYLSNGTSFGAGAVVEDFASAYRPGSVGYGDVNGDHLGDVTYQDSSNKFWVGLQGYDWFK